MPSTPLVFIALGDPVSLGLVRSLSHPGGNATGFATGNNALPAKRLQLIKEAIPAISRVAVMIELATATQRASMDSMEEAARGSGISLRRFEITKADDIGPAFSEMAKERPDALIVLATAVTYVERARIADLAIKHKVPTMASYVEAADAGALMSYAPNLQMQFRRVGNVVDRILKGVKPGELPVEMPNFELIINRRTAKALNVELAPSAFARADRVIE